MARPLPINPTFLPPTHGVLKSLLENPLKLPFHHDEGTLLFCCFSFLKLNHLTRLQPAYLCRFICGILSFLRGFDRWYYRWTQKPPSVTLLNILRSLWKNKPFDIIRRAAAEISQIKWWLTRLDFCWRELQLKLISYFSVYSELNVENNTLCVVFSVCWCLLLWPSCL